MYLAVSTSSTGDHPKPLVEPVETNSISCEEMIMPTPISIIIVDDHEVVRNGIRAYLETLDEFTVVGEASSGEEAIKLVSDYIPDVVLMDLIMPGMDGVETTRRVRAISPRTQVVVLTSYHEDIHIFPALKAGAISYVLKDMKMDKLVDAIIRAVHGEVTLHPRVAARVLQNLRGENADEPQLFTDLTERERDVLKLIANGLSNTQIAEKLVISENTVKGHVSNILSKLHLADRTQAAVYAWQKGIVQRDGGG
jgi:two-component system, NarL family, response regulator LiaR